MDYSIQKEESKIFNVMKAVGMLGVLLIHADLRHCSVEQTRFTDFYNEFFSLLLPSAAVPVFFFLSGFFLFKDYVFRDKLRNRARSLAVPYLIWCSWGLAIVFVLQFCLGLENLFSGKDLKLLRYFSIVDYVRSFWDIRDGAPIISTLWFLRDLCVMVVLSPVINALLSKRWLANVYIAALLVWWLAGGTTGTVVILSSLVFFSLGGYCMKLNVGVPHGRGWVVANVCFLVASVVAYLYASEAYLFFKKLYVFSCVPTLYVYCSCPKLKDSVLLEKLQTASFFVYLFHEPWMGYLQKIVFKIVATPPPMWGLRSIAVGRWRHFGFSLW